MFFYFLTMFVYFLQCPINLNGKEIRLRVIWSIFEENKDLYNDLRSLTNANSDATNKRTQRFRINLSLYQKNKHVLQSPPAMYLYTEEFDTRMLKIDDKVHSMDVQIIMNDSNRHITSKFEKIKIKGNEHKILILPFHEKFKLQPFFVPYDESIFAKPVRHFHFVILSPDITPKSIGCVENGKKVNWSYEFEEGQRVLDIQEAVCRSDVYKFEFSDKGEKAKKHDMFCDQPIYELDFMNRLDIKYNGTSFQLTCKLNRERGIQKSVDKTVQISKNSEATRRAPFLEAYKFELEKIVAEYEKLTGGHSESLMKGISQFLDKQKEADQRGQIESEAIRRLANNDDSQAYQMQSPPYMGEVGVEQHAAMQAAQVGEGSGSQIAHQYGHIFEGDHGESSGSGQGHHPHIQLLQGEHQAVHSPPIYERQHGRYVGGHGQEKQQEQQMQPAIGDASSSSHNYHEALKDLKRHLSLNEQDDRSGRKGGGTSPESIYGQANWAASHGQDDPFDDIFLQQIWKDSPNQSQQQVSPQNVHQLQQQQHQAVAFANDQAHHHYLHTSPVVSPSSFYHEYVSNIPQNPPIAMEETRSQLQQAGAVPMSSQLIPQARKRTSPESMHGQTSQHGQVDDPFDDIFFQEIWQEDPNSSHQEITPQKVHQLPKQQAGKVAISMGNSNDQANRHHYSHVSSALSPHFFQHEHVSNIVHQNPPIAMEEEAHTQLQQVGAVQSPRGKRLRQSAGEESHQNVAKSPKLSGDPSIHSPNSTGNSHSSDGTRANVVDEPPNPSATANEKEEWWHGMPESPLIPFDASEIDPTWEMMLPNVDEYGQKKRTR